MFWQLLERHWREIFSGWQNPGEHTYDFRNFCLKTLDPEKMVDYINFVGRRPNIKNLKSPPKKGT